MVNERLESALANPLWQSHRIGDSYSMDGNPDKWKIAYYPIFEDGKTKKKYDEPRALIEKPMIDRVTKKEGTDFREVPLRYLTRV